MTVSTPFAAPAIARASTSVASRRIEQWRRLVLAAAIVATVAAGVLAVLEHAPQLGRLIERALWSLTPAEPVANLSARAAFTDVGLAWAAEERAASYTLTIARDPALTDAVERMTTTSPHVVLLGLDQGATYFYRVSWTSALGNEGVPSPVERVTTGIHQVAAPADVGVASSARDFTLSWSPVEWATKYVVRMSVAEDPSAFGDSPADREFAATTDTRLSTGPLAKAAGERYYFTVRAWNDDVSSAVSSPVRARLLLDPPSKVSAVGASTSGVTLSWSAVAEADSYIIERSSSADFSTVQSSFEVPDAYGRMAVNGLEPGSQYYFRVRAQDGNHAGENSGVVTATTSGSPSVKARVATFNILDPALGTSLAPWRERRKSVAKTIDAAHADIVALQEAGWSRVSGGLTPAQDIKGILDKTMVLSKAGYRGDQLLYSPSKYRAGRHGSFRLPRLAGDGERSAIWQIFTDKKQDIRFMVVSTHLTNGMENNAGRVRQAKTILHKIKALNPGVPVVLMGDFNSYDERTDVTPMSLFADAGYLDAELSTPATDTPHLNTMVWATSTTGRVRFDHIAVSEDVAIERTQIENPELSAPASDHRLLWADIAISSS